MDHEDGSKFAMDDFYIKGLGIMQAEKVGRAVSSRGALRCSYSSGTVC